jgi:CysZ protein
MNAFSDHIYAIKRGLDELSKGKFWIYLIPSVLISLVFLVIYGVIRMIFGAIELLDLIPFIGPYIASGVQGIQTFVDFIMVESYAFFILTILSPVSCLLSEKVDNELTGAKFSGGIARILADLFRTILIVLVALVLNLVVMGIWWFISSVTGFHALDDLIYFCIGAFFIGFSFYDFSLERYRVATFGSWNFGFSNVPYMLMTGALFALIFRIPYLGIMFAPFLLTIFSTIVYLKMSNRLPLATTSRNAE